MAKRTVQVLLSGAVQGGGIRPALARLARHREWNGSVRNTTVGVSLIVSGDMPDDEQLAVLIRNALPANSRSAGIALKSVSEWKHEGFQIEKSDGAGSLAVPPPRDIAICRECLAEANDPTNRRYLYPFSNCAECGPRYSLLLGMPFDRERTTMRRFLLCRECRREYDDPSNRRFHAQTICCPECGPQVWATRTNGHQIACRDEAVRMMAEAISGGGIIALKGVGGYQIFADATSSHAVMELRRRKQRPSKPLAVLCHSMGEAQSLAFLNEAEEQQLTSPQNPIVLLRQRQPSALAPEVNPRMSDIGLLLPTTALHDRLVKLVGRPLICTSGNRDGEPLASQIEEAEHRLLDVADFFLHHDRDISQPIDDSVVRVIANRPVTIRNSRGLAPLPLRPECRKSVRCLPERRVDAVSVEISTDDRLVCSAERITTVAEATNSPCVAVGGHQKSSVAISNGSQWLLGPHVGDLDTVAAQEESSERLHQLCELSAVVSWERDGHVAHDPHPGYFPTRWCESNRVNRLPVWHHHAHIAVGMLEHQLLDQTVLGVAFDGTGLGPDGTIWGGEFLIATATHFQRVAHFRPFGLPGGDVAIHDLRRLTVSMLSQLEELSPDLIAELSELSRAEVSLVQQALLTKWTPHTTSCGRLFDVAANLILRCSRSEFEGHPAMVLESACDRSADGEYSFVISSSQPLVLDWHPVIRQLIADRDCEVAPSAMAMRFHRAVASAIRGVCNRWPELPVVLGGGVFQNRILVELLADSWPSHLGPLILPGQIPPNDGGLSAGQLAVMMSTLAEEKDRQSCV